MKVMKLTALSAVMLGCIINSVSVKAADPVTLNITGNIVASPCQVSSDSITKAVDLGQAIQSSTLQVAGSATSWVNFDININACPSGTTKAKMTMHGSADTNNPGDMYKNTGSAGNIAVQLQGTGGDPMGDGKTYTGVIASNAYSYHLKARAYTQNGAVTPGTINSVVTATFEYQ